MRQFSSTRAKQSFGELLEAAARGPVAIERHGRIKAIVASPQTFHAAGAAQADLAQRRAARLNQTLLEKERLIRHQKVAIQLLTLPARERRALIRQARAVVERWRADNLCSRDYIDRWQSLLELPIDELASAMTSDADGWGNALRQNSPWAAVGR